MGFGVYLPVAGNSVNVFLLVGVGSLIGLLSGLFGIGGFLLTPLLMMAGVPATVAAASGSNMIVGASSSGVFAHARGGTVDFKMGILILIGGLAGGTLGVPIIHYLRVMGEASFAITVTYVVMLGGVGGYMFYDSLRELRSGVGKERTEASPQRPSINARLVGGLPWKVDFKKSGIRLSVLVPMLLGALVGVLAAVMGVGGGFIMVPVMVYLLRMPMHIVVGTSLFQMLFTCSDVTVMQAWINHTVDFVLALVMLFGSVVGAQFGARINRRLKAEQLKILMSLIVLAVMAKMLLGLLIAPQIVLH
jgi:uncharacterized membrane protein YfcA